MGGGGIIEKGRGSCEDEAEDKKWHEQADNAASGTEYGDDFVAARHLGQGVKHGQENPNGETHENDFRSPPKVKFQDERKRCFVI